MRSLPSPTKIPERLRSKLKPASSQPDTVQDTGARCPKKDPDVYVRTKTFSGLRVIDQNKPAQNAQVKREQFRKNTPRRHTLAFTSSDEKKDGDKKQRSAEELREEFKHKLMKKFPKSTENYYGDGGSSASEDGFRMRPGPGKRHAARRRTTVVNYNPDSSRSTDQDERNTSMSEIDTESLSSQPLQRGGSLRSSLPIVRSPNHSFDRPIGLVFLIFGDETKRGLLPNEVTQLDTVRALFVRSFPDKLSMQLFESRPQLKIYIQDQKSGVFYQLEDLRDIQEHCILKVHYCDSHEPQRVRDYTKVRGKTILSPPRPTSDPRSPTFRGEHSDKNGVDQTSSKATNFPMVNSNYHNPGKRPQQMRDLPEIRYRPLTPDVAHTSPEGRYRGPPIEEQRRMLPERPFSPDRLALGTIPEYRQPSPGMKRHTSPRAVRSAQSTPTPMDSMGPSSGRSTPTASLVAPHQYSKYRSLSPTGRSAPIPHRSPPGQFVRERTGYHSDGSPQVKHGPVFPAQAPMYVAKGVRATTCSTFSPQRATGAPPPPRESDLREMRDPRNPNRNSLVYEPVGIPPIPRQPIGRAAVDRGEGPRRPQNLGPANSVSDGQICRRSQSYRMPGDRSDQRGRPRSGTPQATDYDPEGKIRIEKMEAQLANLTAWVHSAVVPNGSGDPGSRSSSLRSLQSGSAKSSSTSSSLNDLSTATKHTQTICQPPLILSKELSNGLLLLHKRTVELKVELKGLRRLQQLNMEGARESIDEVYGKIKVALTTVPGVNNRPVRQLRLEVDTVCDTFKQDKERVQKQLHDLEKSVEEMRNDVISRQCRVNMSEVEGMALALSQIAKSLADLKGRLPPLISSMKSVMAGEMEVVVKEERFVKEEPDSIETCFRKCKKLTGTLFTMKRLASVQEQRPPQIPVIGADRSDKGKKSTVFENIQCMVPNHDARLQSLEEADASRERKRRLAAQQEALKFEKNLELATKNLKSRNQERVMGSGSGRTTPVTGSSEVLAAAGGSDKISNVGELEFEGPKKVPRSQSLDPDDRDRDDPDSLTNQKMQARAEFFRSLRSASPPDLPKQTSKLDWVVEIPKCQPTSSSSQDSAPVKPDSSSPCASPVSKIPGPSARLTQSSPSKPSDSASSGSPTSIPQLVQGQKLKSGSEDGDKKKIPPPPPPRSSTRSTTQSQPSFSSFYSTISSPSKLECSVADDQGSMNLKSSRAVGLPVASTPVVGAPKKPANNFEKGIMNVVYVNVHAAPKGSEPSKPAAGKLNAVDNPTDNGNDQESEAESTSSVDSQKEAWRLRSDAKGAKPKGNSGAAKPRLSQEEVKFALARKKPPPPPQRKSSVLSRKDLTDRLQDQTTKTSHLKDQHDRLEMVETEQDQISKQHQILEEEQKQMAKGKKKP